MNKKCEKCGKEFKASQPHFRLCPNCFSSNRSNLSDFLLKSYFDQENNLLKEVFIGVPDELASIFANSKPPLTTKQLRTFHQVILKARTKALLKGIKVARPILWKCKTDAAYQLKRRLIPLSFVRFLEHHIPLAEKDEEALDGFFQHFDNIVCYFPK